MHSWFLSIFQNLDLRHIFIVTWPYVLGLGMYYFKWSCQHHSIVSVTDVTIHVSNKYLCLILF